MTVDPPRSILVAPEPLVTHQNQNHVACLDRRPDLIPPTSARSQRVEIHEDPRARKSVVQTIMKPVCRVLTVSAPIRDEDPQLTPGRPCKIPQRLTDQLLELIGIAERRDCQLAAQPL